jgi:hypothetical protein
LPVVGENFRKLPVLKSVVVVVVVLIFLRFFLLVTTRGRGARDPTRRSNPLLFVPLLEEKCKLTTTVCGLLPKKRMNEADRNVDSPTTDDLLLACLYGKA